MSRSCSISPSRPSPAASASLDPRLAGELLTLLLRHARAPRALLLSLHRPDLLAGFDRVLALRDGAVVFDGPVQQLDASRLQALYGAAAPEAQHEGWWPARVKATSAMASTDCGAAFPELAAGGSEASRLTSPSGQESLRASARARARELGLAYARGLERLDDRSLKGQRALLSDLLAGDAVLGVPLRELLERQAFQSLPGSGGPGVSRAWRDSLLQELGRSILPELLDQVGEFLDGVLAAVTQAADSSSPGNESR